MKGVFKKKIKHEFFFVSCLIQVEPHSQIPLTHFSSWVFFANCSHLLSCLKNPKLVMSQIFAL